MSSESEEGEISNNDSEFSVDLKTNKIKKRTKKKKNKKTPKIITSTYKKEKCVHFNKGNCTKGETCTFSHDFEPESSKVNLSFIQIICKYFLSGSCSKGEECNFSHNTQNYPCKFFHLENRCNQKTECRFSHLPVSKEQMNDFLKENKDLILTLSREQKLGFISDENLKKEIALLVSKETAHDEPKKKGFKGELKLLAQNNIELNEGPMKSKPVDPRLKMKASKQIKVEEPVIVSPEEWSRNWITEVKETSLNENNNIGERKVDKNLMEKFLYSYY